jgi:predicted ATPase
MLRIKYINGMDEFTEKIKYLKCRRFFPDYCGIKYNSYTMQQLAGINWRGKPTKLNPRQKQKVIEGLEKFIEDLKKIQNE